MVSIVSMRLICYNAISMIIFAYDMCISNRQLIPQVYEWFVGLLSTLSLYSCEFRFLNMAIVTECKANNIFKSHAI